MAYINFDKIPICSDSQISNKPIDGSRDNLMDGPGVPDADDAACGACRL